MKRLTVFASMALAAMMACACGPGMAQDVKISAMPSASTLTGSEKLAGVQGAVCATSTAPCSNVSVTPVQLETFLETYLQPIDSDLTAIAALSTTSTGRDLLTSANAAAIRTKAGTVIGTDVEAHDSDLTTIAGLSPANDDFLQRKSGAWTNRTPTQARKDLGAPLVMTGGTQMSHTGDTAESTFTTITLPGGSLGPNGQMEMELLVSGTGSGNKTFRIKFGGTTYTGYVLSGSNTSAQIRLRIANRNSQSSQVSFNAGTVGAGSGASTSSLITSSVDSSADVSILLTGQLATGTEIGRAHV